MPSMVPATEWPTPGGVSQGAWQSPGYRPGLTRSRLALVLVGMTTLGYLAQLLWTLRGFSLVQDIYDGRLTAADGAAYDAIDGGLVLATLLVYVVSAVAFLAWFSRMVENVPPLTGWVPRRSPKEAIGWWFVPFANFWIPYTIASDSVRRLDPRGRTWGASVMLVWWVTFWAGSVLSNLAGRLLDRAGTLDEITAVLIASTVALAFSTISGVSLATLIASVERTSASRAAALGLPRSGDPRWPDVAYVVAGRDDEVAHAAESTLPPAITGEPGAGMPDAAPPPPPPPG